MGLGLLFFLSLPACVSSTPGDVGQSGNEGTSVIGRLSYPCYSEQAAVFTAEVTSINAGCFVGEVLSPLTEQTDPVGELVGGAMHLHWTSEQPEVGETVAIDYTRGAQDGASCPEYRACSQNECGSPYDPDNIDEYDPELVEAWDMCDENCLEETREECAENSDLARLGGTVRVSPLVDGKIEVEWRGGTYLFTAEELTSKQCPSLFEDLPDLRDSSETDPSSSSQSSVDGGPPPGGAPVSCPAE